MLAIFSPTPHYKGRTFELWVLNRKILNFCVRITPLRGSTEGKEEEEEEESLLVPSYLTPSQRNDHIMERHISLNHKQNLIQNHNTYHFMSEEE